MTGCDLDLDSRRPPRRKRAWLLVAAAALALTAWVIAHHPPVRNISSLDEVSVSYNLMVAGAIPWFFQWACVVVVVVAFWGSQKTRGAALFAICGSLATAAIWWIGLAFRFRGMDPLDAILDATALEIELGLGGGTAFDQFLFHVLGPMLGPIRLHGPLSFRGWDFLLSMLSTTLVMGYLLVVGGLGSRAQRSNTASDCLKFMAAVFLCFAPPFIRLAVRIWHTA
jgi:hypothetical protein